MSDDLIEKAYGTLFPVTNELTPSRDILSFLDKGGRALLFGEYADEYASGRMRPERVAAETVESWTATLADLRARSGRLLFACDADIAAVNRLHHVAGELPSREEAIAGCAGECAAALETYARRVRALGVNMVLSPTADCVTSENPWLAGRTLGDDLETVSRIVSTFVSAARRGGLQTALKHFPGHNQISGNPSRERAVVPLHMTELLRQAAPFKAGIDAGADAVLMGSAIFTAVTPHESASLSAELIRLLRDDFAFSGLVVTLDLDHASVMGRRSIEDVCISALISGADLLLLSPTCVPHIASIAKGIARAVESGRLEAGRLNAAVAATFGAAR